MQLTDEQKRMYAGEFGPGVQKAMNVLIKYGDAFGAERLINVNSCHVGMNTLPYTSEMLESVDHIRAFTTIHAGSAGACRFNRALGLTEDYCRQEVQTRDEALKKRIRQGFIPTLSCAPYLLGNVAKMGDVFSWPGSSGILISNSLFGARGNRDAFPATLASSITGLTPEMLLHKKENRYGQVLFRLHDLDMEGFTEADYGAIGYYIGAVAGLRNVVVDGLPGKMPFEKLKYFLSPMPVSGAVSLCHIVGTTPEAPTVEEALGHKKPEEMIIIGRKEYSQAYESLHTAKKDEIDVVFFGCPHLTISEIGLIARLLDDNRIADRVRLWVSTAEQIYDLSRRMGYVDKIEKAGGLVITDTCLNSFPYDKLEVKATFAATNSARAASYQARWGMNIQYGSVEDCIKSAISGMWEGRYDSQG